MQQKKVRLKRLSQVLAVVAAITFLGTTSGVFACGWGTQGGADYVPQERNVPQQQVSMNQSISPEQAKEIVARYIRGYNHKLTIGTPNDAGSYYEVDLLGKNGEVVQVLGVDKSSGRVQVLN